MYKLLPILIFSFLLFGCDYKSETMSVKEVAGKAYLLDQDKKQVFLISQDQLIELKRTTPLVLKDGQIIKQTRTISDGRLIADVKIKFLGNKALYSLTITPVTKTVIKDKVETKDKSNFEWFAKLTKDYNSNKFVSLQFQDPDGFKLLDHNVKVSQGYTQMVDGNGGYSAYVYEDSISIYPDTAKYITNVDFVWNI